MPTSTERSHLWLFAILAIVGFIGDQTSKYVVFSKLYPEDSHQVTTTVVVIPDWFSLQTNYSWEKDAGNDSLSFLRTISGERLPFVNKGALFGWGNDGEGLNWLFALISVAAALFIVYWVRRPNVATDRWLCIALGLILGGTFGNLYDRIVFTGVRDFLHWYYVTEAKVHVWPDFNIADCCLVSGAFVLLAHSIFAKEPTTESNTSAPPMEAPAPVVASTSTSSTV